jgi:hypothetical protein
MSTAVFLIGYLCLGLPGDVECKNIASKFLYVGMQDCMIAKEEIKKDQFVYHRIKRFNWVTTSMHIVRLDRKLCRI